MTAIIFRAFPFRPFPKKKQRERTGIYEKFPVYPFIPKDSGTHGNGRERTGTDGFSGGRL